MFGETHSTAIGNQLEAFQFGLSVFQRQVSQILALQKQQVKHHERKVPPLPLAKGILQELEFGHSLIVEGDDLAVENGSVEVKIADSFHQLGQLRRPIQLIARNEADARPIDGANHPITVELDFVKPIVAIGRDSVTSVGNCGVMLAAADDGFCRDGRIAAWPFVDRRCRRLPISPLSAARRFGLRGASRLDGRFAVPIAVSELSFLPDRRLISSRSRPVVTLSGSASVTLKSLSSRAAESRTLNRSHWGLAVCGP